MTVDLRRSPLAGTGFGVSSAGLTMAEEPFRTLLEVRRVEPPVPAWRIGPDWWLVDADPVGSSVLEAPLAATLREAGCRVTDTSAHRTTLALTGAYAATVIAHGCPIDVTRLAVGDAVQGTLAGAPVTIGAVEDGYRVYVRAAFARHLAAWLMDASLEYV